jgi:hypothetical protein
LPRQRLGSRHGVRPPGSNRDHPVVGLDQVAVAGKKIGGLHVHHEQHRFEAAQDPVGAPVLHELDSRPFEIPSMLFELGFETGEQRKGICGRAGEAGQDPAVVQLPDLPGAVLHNSVAEADLAVAGHHGLVPVAHC